MGLFGKKEKPEGIIESYSVIYLGGHANYPKGKSGAIKFDVFETHFDLSSTIGTKNWFNGLIIPYTNIQDLRIVQRQLGTVEGLLGGLNSRQLNQPNNIHITYIDDAGTEVLLRLEMLTGVTVMGQAKKCLEFEDLLRVKGIRNQFAGEQPTTNSPNIDDIPSQIEKLASLLEKGLITKEEFDNKKSDLLSRM